MDSKHLVKLVGMKVIPYRSKTTGAAEEIRLAQCVISSDDAENGPKVIVGELMMPKHLWDLPLGDYLAEFELAVDKTLRIGARLTKLHAVGQSVTPRPASGKEPEKKAA
jgi:hypothetical protein